MEDPNQNNQQNNQGNQGGDPGNQGNQQGNQNNQGGQGSEGKTYTQEQINSMMAAEKRTARNALLKELGFEGIKDENYKDTVAGIKKTLDAGKTQQQLDKEAKEAAEAAKSEAEGKVARLELQVAALKFGVKPDYVEDIIALAAPQVSETKTIDTILGDLKKKYPSSFGEDEAGNSGTGSNTNPGRKPGASGVKGQDLAKNHRASAPAKSSYFKNN